mgnify:CR=1 FL=1
MQLQGEYTMVSSRLPSLYDDDFVAMMSGGVLEVDLFLISRNTLGNGKNRKLKISNVKCQNGGSGKAVVVCTWQCESGMMGYTHVGVEVVVPK